MGMLLARHRRAPDAQFVPIDEPAGEANADKPAKTAPKQDWVDYAVSQGHQEGSLEELTKAEIQSLFE